MFVKLGQLLATRPDLLPPPALAELSRLQASARPLPRPVIEAALAAEVGPPEALFEDVRWEPLGSASIAQAHVARLRDGPEVIVKIRRPGLEEAVERDLAIALWLGRMAERRTAWGRTYGVSALVEEFADALRDELDFRREARAAAEMARALATHPEVRAPAILEEHTTERLLVMERLHGTPLAAVAPHGLGPRARQLADELCASQVRAMLDGERFHGDPHPGNVLLLDDGTLGLIDFGVTGKLDAFERSSMFQLLLAIELRQPALLHEALVAVGAVSPGRHPDHLERALARLMAAHLGPGLPPADALAELLHLTAELGIRLPPQAGLMFRAMATLAGTLEHLCPGYPLVEQVGTLGGDAFRARLAPSSVRELVQQEWVQLGPLLQRAPRHLDRIATMLEHDGVPARLRLFTDDRDVRILERLLNRAVMTVLSLGIGTLAVLMLGTDAGPTLAGGVRLLEVLGWAGLFAGAVLVLRVLLDVLRSEVRAAPR